MGQGLWREESYKSGFHSCFTHLPGSLTCYGQEWKTSSENSGGPPVYPHSFKIWNLQGFEEDASTPGSSYWLREVVVGDYFSCFLLEDDSSSSVDFTAAIETLLNRPACRMKRGAQWLNHLGW